MRVITYSSRDIACKITRSRSTWNSLSACNENNCVLWKQNGYRVTLTELDYTAIPLVFRVLASGLNVFDNIYQFSFLVLLA